MSIISIKSKVKKVDTFLTNTFISWGNLSPRSNVKINFNTNDILCTVMVGQNRDTKETYFFTEHFILIFPENSFEIVNKNFESNG